MDTMQTSSLFLDVVIGDQRYRGWRCVRDTGGALACFKDEHTRFSIAEDDAGQRTADDRRTWVERCWDAARAAIDTYEDGASISA